MSIEDKAKEIFVPQEYMECENASDEAYMKRDAFQRGANWMLEKAINWLNDKVMFDEVGRPIKIEQFRKEMED